MGIIFEGLNNLDNVSALRKITVPIVPISETVTDDYIICLEDGKKLKMLKRHLNSFYQMTLEQYKERWGLPYDYPTVAPNYAKRRSQIAKEAGLGFTRTLLKQQHHPLKA